MSESLFKDFCEKADIIYILDRTSFVKGTYITKYYFKLLENKTERKMPEITTGLNLKNLIEKEGLKEKIFISRMGEPLYKNFLIEREFIEGNKKCAYRECEYCSCNEPELFYCSYNKCPLKYKKEIKDYLISSHNSKHGFSN